MSAAERKSKKIYYTMGEVSEMFDVNPSLIRFWEQKFDILKPDKNKKGNRLFTPADIENLKLIYHLVKENGMTLAGAQKRIKQNREGLGRDLEIVDRLQRIRAMLLEVRQELKGADENVVEIFVDHPSVPAEEHEAGGGTAVCARGTDTISVRAASTQATVNGKTTNWLAVPAELRGGIFCVPVRFFAEAAGADVTWDAAGQTFYLTTEIQEG